MLIASTAEYYMKALGIKLAEISIQISENEPVIEIKAKSLKETAISPQLNNIYRIEHNGSYQPITYTRVIRQKNVNDKVIVNYNHNSSQATMIRLSDNSTIQYSIAKNSQDVYSFLAEVIAGRVQTGKYPIDANGVKWQANVVQLASETVDTPLGKYPARHYEITFHNLTEKKMPYIDMVTFNMLQENNKLNLWVYNNQYAVKATFKKKGLSSCWELVNIKK
ncbi:MAG: DUF3108 domain-containing protein [Candidatus Cloacimonas acidaminovorans]|nr:DUF3108 domain-containing protein [Candidatus Cloacimonas acidaminovorans]